MKLLSILSFIVLCCFICIGFSVMSSSPTIQEKFCIDSQDLKLINNTTRKQMNDIFKHCAIKCILTESSKCLVTCLQGYGFTLKCSSCIAYDINCSKKNCIVPCTLEPLSISCKNCVDKFCTPTFLKCSGVKLP